MAGHPQGYYHSRDNDDPIIGNGKSKYADAFPHIFQINTQIGKINHTIHRYRLSRNLHVKTEENYISILHYVLLAFHAHQAFFPGTGIGTAIPLEMEYVRIIIRTVMNPAVA